MSITNWLSIGLSAFVTIPLCVSTVWQCKRGYLANARSYRAFASIAELRGDPQGAARFLCLAVESERKAWPRKQEAAEGSET